MLLEFLKTDGIAKNGVCLKIVSNLKPARKHLIDS